jgi:hypothetical protein
MYPVLELVSFLWLVFTHRTGILVADAGCILQSLTDYIAPHNHIMPIDLGAKGRCVYLAE